MFATCNRIDYREPNLQELLTLLTERFQLGDYPPVYSLDQRLFKEA
jgi:hypothetical protein